MTQSHLVHAVLHQLHNLTPHSLLLGIGQLALTSLSKHLLGAAAKYLLIRLVPDRLLSRIAPTWLLPAKPEAPALKGKKTVRR